MRFFLFLWGVLSLGYAPGALLLHFLKRSLTPLEHVSLSVTLGLVMSAAMYWLTAITPVVFGLSRTAEWPALFVAWPVGAVGLLLYLRRRDLSNIRLELEPSHVALAAVLALGVIVLVKLPLFFGNLTIATDEGMTVVPISDALLHVAIANELTHTIPPQNPLFAGQPLSYHYGMDLVTAMMARATGLTVADLTVRFVPMLLMIAGMLSAFCFSRRWLAEGPPDGESPPKGGHYGEGPPKGGHYGEGPPKGGHYSDGPSKGGRYAEGATAFAVLTVFLVFFGEDLSFIPGLMRGWQFDWTRAFNVPSVFSLFYINPMLPALGLLFTGLFCLQKYLDAPDVAWLTLSAVCFAALAEVKVFTAAHVLGSLGVTALVYVVCSRRLELFKVTVLTALLTTPFLLNTILQNQAGARIEVIPGPAGYVAGAMQRLGLQETVTGVPALLAIGLPLFLTACLGLRVVGGWAIVKSMLHPVASRPLRFMLAFFVVAGIVLTLTVRIVPEGQGGYDNGVWFFVQSKFVASIFAAEFLRRWYGWLRSRTPGPALAAIAIIGPAVALAAPSTIQHFIVLASDTAASDPAATSAARFVASRARPGDVVLANQAVMGRVLTYAPVRLPVGYFADTLVSADSYKRREAVVFEFWRDWESGTIRSDILRQLGTRFVSAVRPAGLQIPPGVVELYSKSDYVVLELPLSP